MIYKLKTPNHLYSGVTEGVPFSHGIGQTDNKNIRNVLVNDYKYEDITDYPEEVEETAEEESTEDTVKRTETLSDMTVPQLKELAKSRGLTHYSDLKHAELVELLEETTK